jgi:WD40 repeat protein
VYHLRDEKWNAVISNGSGGMGKNVHVEFGEHEGEVLVWSDFTACVKIWCLKTGRAVEIRDPKFSGKDGKGWGYRPCTDTAERGRSRGGVLALLCRSAGTDILLLLAANTYTVLSRTELPTTDAAGLKWSRDGRWLAISEAPSAGYKLLVYTADGHLYRSITREPPSPEEASEWDVEGLGIKTLEWVPGNERLAVGGWDRRVRILSTRTFAPIVYLDHTEVIHVPSAPVYMEHVDGKGMRRFEITQQPVTPPKAALEKNETGLMKQGIGLLAFNNEGTMCATRDDSTPCTVWIWDLRILRPRAILVMHSLVKHLLWHPTDPSRLLIQTNLDEPTIYLYTTTSQHSPTSSSSSANSRSTTQQQRPLILSLTSQITKPAPASGPPKYTTTWLSTPMDKKPALLLTHQQSYLVVWPQGKDQILRFEHEDQDEESDDSLFEILTGKTNRFKSSAEMDVDGQRKVSGGDGVVMDIDDDGVERDEGYYNRGYGDREDEAFRGSVDTVGEGGLEDTFREKHGRYDVGRPSVSEEERQDLYETSGLGESGLSEMF